MKKKLYSFICSSICSILLTFPIYAAVDYGVPQSPKNSAGVVYRENELCWADTAHGRICCDAKTGIQFKGQWLHSYKTDNGKNKSVWYYFNENGIMQKGLLYWDNDIFYLQEDGTALIKEELVEINGNQYMFNLHGTAYKNETVTRGDQTYTFDKNGCLINQSAYEKPVHVEEYHQNLLDQVSYLNCSRARKGISPLLHNNELDKIAQQIYETRQKEGTVNISDIYSKVNHLGHGVEHVGYIFAFSDMDSSSCYLTEEATNTLTNLWFSRMGYYKANNDIMIILAAYSGESASIVSTDIENGTWKRINNQWTYERSDGFIPKSCWYKVPADNLWYHFDGNGYIQTGWFQDADGKWYYLSPESGAMQSNTYVDGYWLTESGAMQ